jgi:hypothetical protein
VPDSTQLDELKLMLTGGAGLIVQISVPTSKESSWLGVTEKFVERFTENVGA